MLRSISLACALLLSAAIAAVETPLTLTSGTKTVVVDPSFGSITIYQATTTNVTRMGVGRENGNFLSALSMMAKFPKGQQEKDIFWELRTGWDNNQPAYGEFFDPRGKQPFLDPKPTKAETAAGKDAAMVRAMKGENAFWKTVPEYDGKLSAALSLNGGQYLAIAVPSTHTLMVFKLDNDEAKLFAVHNWGPELFIPSGVSSRPAQTELLNSVPQDKKKQAMSALGLDEDATKPAPEAPKLGVGAAEAPPTPKSEVWLGAVGIGSSAAWMLVDTANSYAMVFSVPGKTLDVVAVRNLNFDLVLPEFISGGWNSLPLPKNLVPEFAKTRGKQLREFGYDVDLDYLYVLASQRQGKAKQASNFEASVSADGSVAFLNFTARRVQLVLNPQAQMLNLVAARDTTIDVALGILDQEIYERNCARFYLDNAVKLARSSPERSLLTLKLVFALDARLNVNAEKSLKTAFQGPNLTTFTDLLNEAATRAKQLTDDEETLKKAAADRKADREKPKGK